MPRIRNEKDYERKRMLIIKHAVDSLERFGYEAFSVNNIMKTAGMTKGTFFHYFDSKKTLINEIVNMILIPMTEAYMDVSNDPTLEPREKIKAMFEAGNRAKGTEKKTTQQLIRLLQKKENQTIMQMITDEACEKCTPIFEKVFIEGNEKGHFYIAQTHGSAFLFMKMIVAINQEIGAVLYKENVDTDKLYALKSKISAFELYSKQLFNYDDETNFYNNSMLKIDLK